MEYLKKVKDSALEASEPRQAERSMSSVELSALRSSPSRSAPPIARPFLRWAGGKGWLVRQLEQLFGEIEFNVYHEPFLGGGSVFFALGSGRAAYLSDKNPALIETYECIKSDPSRVVEYMRAYENQRGAYYAARDARLNCSYERSARFIYLNQTSFNGIYRENLQGIYNVPYGDRTKPFLEETCFVRCCAGIGEFCPIFWRFRRW